MSFHMRRRNSLHALEVEIPEGYAYNNELKISK